MCGDNAIYLARQIASWRLFDMTEEQQLKTIKDNEVVVQAFEYAINDLSGIMCYFLDGDRNCNFYGYKTRFGAIEEIASALSLSLKNHSMVRFGVGERDYGRIADDLTDMVEILKFEVYHNMTTVRPRDKEYKRMASSTTVDASGC